MNLPPALARQIGPFPVAGWLGIIAAGVGVGVLVRRSGMFDPGPDPADVPTVDADPAAGAVAGTGGYGPGAGLPGAFPTGNGQPGAPAAPSTNQEWSMAAVRLLIARGIDPIVADAAIGQYLSGLPLDARHSAALAVALTALGPPPEGTTPVVGVPQPPPSYRPPTTKPVQTRHPVTDTTATKYATYDAEDAAARAEFARQADEAAAKVTAANADALARRIRDGALPTSLDGLKDLYTY